MATLLLTTIGTAIGGPVGGALGALIGQRVDGVLFAPKGREGPRLTDLSVQTSSYGSAIPRVFGTMRVAGSVVWSTDLIETRATSHAKGQPSVTTYSYAASFAVLLSARPILRVGRIWADGNLLRGAAGDLKVRTGFRLYLGDEDQAADPMIAAVEGAGATPALRGQAYAVFEGLDLADFGNRIPSLTFEVTADDAPVGVGAIAAAISDGTIADQAAARPLHGFSAYGASVRDTVTLLAEASGAGFAVAGRGLAMTDADSVETTVIDAGFAADASRAQRVRRAVAAIETVPRTLSVAHYDPARDYQTGVQQARRPGAGLRDERLDLPAAIAAADAKTLAEAALARAETGRETRTVALDADAAAIAPGTIVAIAGESGRWRVTRVSLEAMVTTLDLRRLAAGMPAATATSGRVLSSPDLRTGATLIVAAELPPIDDGVPGAPRLSVLATGSARGWRRAALFYSIDGGASWADGGATAAPAILGTLATVPGRASAMLVDTISAVEVVLARADMMLAGADDAALDRGANLALIGDELVQFGHAAPLGAGRWRLSRLWRGRRGTESAIGTQAAGDRFALLAADCIATLPLPVSAIGGVRVLASGVGDDTPVAVDASVTGASVRPPAPVRPTLTGEVLHWTRRSRGGFRWIDGADAPLSEETESYRVRFLDPAGATRSLIVAAPECAVTPADLAAGHAIQVRQLGMLAESAPATLAF